MIKANDLRIGNVFMRPVGTFVLVDSINKNGFQYLDIDDKSGAGGWHSFHDGTYLRPIPLSLEILEKCGFENVSYSNPVTSQWRLKTAVHFTVGFCESDYGPLRQSCYFSYKEIEGKNYGRYFRHLHDLQNIYSELTGTE